MSYYLSQRSMERLDGVDPLLIEILLEAIEISPIDFGIPQYGGVRAAEEQNQLFTEGKSKCDGYIKVGAHQFGKAFDVYAYVAGKASWDPVHLGIIAGVILSVAKRRGVKLRWGGTFGKKGKLFKGWDMGHFERVD